MNRKKIALLLTGLVVTSGVLTSCGSDNKTAQNNSKMMQEDSVLRKASERNIIEHYENYNFPDVAYAEDIMENNLDKNESFSPIDNGEENFIPEQSKTEKLIPENLDDSLRNYDKRVFDVPELASRIGEEFSDKYPMENENDVNLNNFDNSNYEGQQISGFSNVVEDDILDGEIYMNKNSSPVKEEKNYSQDKANEIQNFSENGTNNIQNIEPKISQVEEFNEPSSKPQENIQSQDFTNVEPTPLAGTQVSNKEVGKITVVSSQGGVDIPSENLLGKGQRPQGTVEVSFKLSGDVLSILSLRENLQAAYEEARVGANNNHKDESVEKRIVLAQQLQNIFEPSDGIEVFFESSKGTQSFYLNSKYMFPIVNTTQDTLKPEEKDYLMRMIDLNYADNTRTIDTKSNRNPENIVIRMVLKEGAPKDAKGLYTNTNYKFVGTKDYVNLKVKDPSYTGSQSSLVNGELKGFQVQDFKTAKQLAKIDALDPTGQNHVLFNHMRKNFNEEVQNLDNIYLNQSFDTMYINFKKLIEKSGAGQPDLVVDDKAVNIRGTSIRFNNLILIDPDNTIENIKFEDKRGDKYDGKLIKISKESEPASYCVEIVGLKRDSEYTFKNMQITSNVNGISQTKTIKFGQYDKNATAPPKASVPSYKIVDNTISIRTAKFAGPQLKIVPGEKITLPGGILVDAVKNDSTALRYIVKIDNPEGFIGDVSVNGLRGDEKYLVEKIVDETTKTNYYVITLYNLKSNYDYGFVTIQTNYTDPNGNKLQSNQSLKEINVPDEKAPLTDNKTENEPLKGTSRFNVIVNDEITPKNSREAEIPVFIDDIQKSFIRVDFIAPKDVNTSGVQCKYENNKLKFTNLQPKSNLVYNVNFIYKDENGQKKSVEKFVNVKTTDVSDYDIKKAIITPHKTQAEVKFELYSPAKSGVKSVTVKDSKGNTIKSTWDSKNQILKLEDLKENSEYSGVVVNLALENGKVIKYNLDSFKTQEDVQKPTGEVSTFVERVYKIALGREPEIEGWNFWIDKLQKKEITATEFIAENLMTQKEFVERELDKSQFVTTMYSLIVNREPDSDGQKYWERKYDEYKPQTNYIAELRIKIAREMMDQPEFKELVTNLKLKY